MIHPDTRIEYSGPVIGHGVLATRRIPRGTIVWARDPLDRTFTTAEVSALPDMLQAQIACYAFVEPDGAHVLCWDLARFMNHSCRPNTTSAGETFDIAIRDIEAGEAVTTDYGNFGFFGPLVCACGEASCRRVIRAAEPDRHGHLWRDEVAGALALVHTVDQPLLEVALRNPADAPLLTPHEEATIIP